MPEFLKEGRPPGMQSDAAVEQRVRGMLAEIERDGESAVRRFSRELDGWDPVSFALDPDQIAAATATVPAQLRAQIDSAHHQVRTFAEAQLDCLRPLETTVGDGVVLGHRLVPVSSVGAYVPGGRYGLISSALMSVATAKAAGVERVVVMSAPRGDGGINAATLYAAHVAGADTVYALGGVQAMGAMAYGALPGLEPVDMIVGAGNAYVAEAKRQLFGRVGIDLLAGPTEVLVIADETARPAVVAADLLAQAEHGPTSPAVLITTSRELGVAVLDEIKPLLAAWSTGDVAGAAWAEHGVVAVVEDDNAAVALADEYASEHLQLQVRDPRWWEERLRNYGTVFSGEETTVSFGDKGVGTNHTLPTNGAARYTGGLWVGTFVKVLTFQRLTREASARVAEMAAGISTAEGMVGHAASAELRGELDRFERLPVGAGGGRS
ncbi:MAG TPA: histidinol dehydrogenase [Conexibacter sp.]|nr:histidinol dehydrogenase [Conexibacter sp.]